MVRGAFSPAWMETIARGVEANLASPGPFAQENVQNVIDALGAKKENDEDCAESGEREELRGRFFDDYVNWRRVPELEAVVRRSPAAAIAAAAMGSRRAQFFHDHVLVKEPGTSMATPWHMDAPYYFVDGLQTASMWVPLERVEAGASTLRFVAGSHLWERLVNPVSWADGSDFHDSAGAAGSDDELAYLPVPNPDAAEEQQQQRVLEWSLEPGDCVLFHFRTLHGARGNALPHAERRRALSLRWVGDDACFVERRGGRHSPPLSAPFGTPGPTAAESAAAAAAAKEGGGKGANTEEKEEHGMVPGGRLREDWFPVLWPQ